MTVDMRPPMPGTSASLDGPVQVLQESVPSGGGAASPESAPSPVWSGFLEADGVALTEPLARALRGAPAGSALECLGVLALVEGAGGIRAGVQPEPRDHREGMAGVGEDRDPLAASALECLGVLALVEGAGGIRAGVQPEPRDHREGMAGVGEDRDPLAASA